MPNPISQPLPVGRCSTMALIFSVIVAKVCPGATKGAVISEGFSVSCCIVSNFYRIYTEVRRLAITALVIGNVCRSYSLGLCSFASLACRLIPTVDC